MLSMIEEIIRDLLIFVAVMFALSIARRRLQGARRQPAEAHTDGLELPRRGDVRGRSRRHPDRADPGTRRAL